MLAGARGTRVDQNLAAVPSVLSVAGADEVLSVVFLRARPLVLTWVPVTRGRSLVADDVNDLGEVAEAPTDNACRTGPNFWGAPRGISKVQSEIPSCWDVSAPK